MVQEYILQGLDCAICANKIETAVRKADNVAQATVNFLSATLRVELAPSYTGNFLPDVEKIVRRYEPCIVVKAKTRGEAAGHTHEEGEGEGAARYAPLIGNVLELLNQTNSP